MQITLRHTAIMLNCTIVSFCCAIRTIVGSYLANPTIKKGYFNSCRMGARLETKQQRRKPLSCKLRDSILVSSESYNGKLLLRNLYYSKLISCKFTIENHYHDNYNIKSSYVANCTIHNYCLSNKELLSLKLQESIMLSFQVAI